MRRITFYCLVFLLLFCGRYAAAAEKPYMEKDNSLSFKYGWQFLQIDGEFMEEEEKDYAKFWDVDKKGFDLSVAYEKKLFRYLGIEMELGYNEISDDSEFDIADTFEYKARNYRTALSAKLYFPLTQRLLVYAGGGGDYYFSHNDMKYQSPGIQSLYHEDMHVFGAHGLAGLEFILIKNPQPPTSFAAPVGFFLEYRYGWFIADRADRGIIDDINDYYGTDYEQHDFDLGGHTVYAGLRWHF